MNSNTRKIFETYKKEWKDLYEILLRKEKYSEYIEKTDIKDIIQFFKNEVDELLESILQEDKEEIKKELMDVIYMLNITILKLMDWNYLENLDNFWKEIKEKMIKRAPHLKTWKKITLEEEKKKWREIKNNR